MKTAEDIRAAAIAYNREYPDCVADAAAGEPQVRVTYAGKQGSRSIIFTVTAGVSRNGFVAAHDPVVHRVNRRDPRVAFSGCIEQHARRIGRQHGGESIPVVVIAHGI